MTFEHTTWQFVDDLTETVVFLPGSVVLFLGEDGVTAGEWQELGSSLSFDRNRSTLFVVTVFGDCMAGVWRRISGRDNGAGSHTALCRLRNWDSPQTAATDPASLAGTSWRFLGGEDVFSFHSDGAVVFQVDGLRLAKGRWMTSASEVRCEYPGTAVFVLIFRGDAMTGSWWPLGADRASGRPVALFRVR